MADISKCANAIKDDCPVRGNCERVIVRESLMQSWMDGEPEKGVGCEHYLPRFKA